MADDSPVPLHETGRALAQLRTGLHDGVISIEVDAPGPLSLGRRIRETVSPLRGRRKRGRGHHRRGSTDDRSIGRASALMHAAEQLSSSRSLGLRESAPRGWELHRYRGTFRSASLEQQFVGDQAETTLLTTRYVLVATAVLHALHALLFLSSDDRAFVGSLAVGLPVNLALLAATWLPATLRHSQLFLAAVIVTIGLVLLGLRVDDDGHTEGMSVYGPLLVFLAFTRAGLPVGTALGTIFVVLAAVHVAAAAWGVPEFELLWHEDVLLLWGVVLNVRSGWQQTVVERRAYTHQRRLGRRKREAEAEQRSLELLLNNILPAPIAVQLKNLWPKMSRKPFSVRHESTTMLQSDIVSFTKLSGSLEAQEVAEMLTEMFALFDALCVKHGLEKIKTVGDAFLAVGGAPEARDDHATAAVNMAIDMVEVMPAVTRTLGPDAPAVEIRVGLHSGPLLSGIVGHERFCWDVFGDVPHGAEHMEQEGEPSRVHISAATKALLEPGLFEFEPVRDGESFLVRRRTRPGMGERQDSSFSDRAKAEVAQAPPSSNPLVRVTSMLRAGATRARWQHSPGVHTPDSQRQTRRRLSPSKVAKAGLALAPVPERPPTGPRPAASLSSSSHSARRPSISDLEEVTIAKESLQQLYVRIQGLDAKRDVDRGLLAAYREESGGEVCFAMIVTVLGNVLVELVRGDLDSVPDGVLAAHVSLFMVQLAIAATSKFYHLSLPLTVLFLWALTAQLLLLLYYRMLDDSWGADVAAVVLVMPHLYSFSSLRLPFYWSLAAGASVALAVAVFAPYCDVELGQTLYNQLVYCVFGLLVSYHAQRASMYHYLLAELLRREAHLLLVDQVVTADLVNVLLPADIARQLRGGDDQQELAAAKHMVRHVSSATVFFVYVCGLREVEARSTPVQFVHKLHSLFALFDECCHRGGVEKIKSVGGAYMAATGLPHELTSTPRPEENHAVAAMDVALALMDAVVDFNATRGEALTLKIGVNTGPLIAGILGTQKFSYDIFGDTVNVASRMATFGVEGEIQATQAAADELRSTFALECRGKLTVKGKSEPLTTWFVRDRLEAAPPPTPTHAAAPRLQSSFHID